MDFRIDPEIQSLLPKQDPETFEQLRQNILASEKIDDLVVLVIESDNDRVLGDGHTRKDIGEGEGVPYATRDVIVPDRAAAIQWVIDNQMGRRNLSPEQRAYYRGKEYLNRKQSHGGQTEKIETPSGQNVQTVSNENTNAKEVAKKHGVNEKTVRRDAEFAEAVDQLAPEAKEEVLSGKSEATKKEVVASVNSELKCSKCRKWGVTPNCQECEAFRASKNGETKPIPPPSFDTPEPPKPPKSGSMIFDDRKIPDAFGKLARVFNDRATALKKQHCPKYAVIRRKLDELLVAWEDWKK